MEETTVDIQIDDLEIKEQELVKEKDIKKEVIEPQEQPQKVDKPAVFKINNSLYSLRFNSDSIDQFETAYCAGGSINGIFYGLRTSGTLAIGALRLLFMLGLYDTSNNAKVSNERANIIFKSLLEKKGVPYLTETIIDRILRDCPFLTLA